MRKKLLLLLTIVFLTLTGLSPVFAEQDEKFRTVNEVALFVEKYYKYGTTAEHLKNVALEYMLKTGDTSLDGVLAVMFDDLDPYSVYMSKDEYERFSGTLTASLSGIGVTIVMNKAGAVITEIIKDSPAEKMGLLPFDIIASVDGIAIGGMPAEEAVTYTHGEAGTAVHLGVLRDGATVPFYVDVVRGNVERSPVYWYPLSDDVAYLALTQLTLNCDVFMAAALKEIDEAGINKIVLDLRDNGGGYLDATVNICNMFMPEGVVGYVDYKDPKKLETFYSTNPRPKYLLAVLINGATASGAEFLSGGLQDTGVGRLFGEQSYGKGTVQTTHQITGGGAFKVTIAKYYTAGKQDVAKNHINPDVEIKNSYRRLNEETFAPMDLDAVLDVGNEGEAVLAVEQRLQALGYLDTADEQFGEDTAKAVQFFKAYQGLMPTKQADGEFNVYLNNIEYDREYVTVDRQLDAAFSYLEGLTK